MRVLGVFPDRLTGLLKGTACQNTFPQFFGDQLQLRACGQGVQHHDTAFRVLPFEVACCLQCRIVGTGKFAGQRYGENLIRITKGLAPFQYIGAGGGGGGPLGLQRGNHFAHIQVGIIHILPVTTENLQGNGGEIHIGQLEKITGRIGNDLIFHIHTPIENDTSCGILHRNC